MTATNLARLNCAESVVKTLIANGIDTLYCLPGVQNDDFFDALARVGGAIRPINARHEQATAYMALGAALATGKPQAYCVVPGPGFLNTTTALATAQSLCQPVLAISGQIFEKSFGMRARRATTPAALGKEIGDALAAGGPALIEAPVGQFPDPWRIFFRKKNRR